MCKRPSLKRFKMKKVLMIGAALIGACVLGDATNLNPLVVHRWGFSSDAPLVDSVGGKTATKNGSVTFADNVATLPGGNKGTGWVGLGSDVLPKDGSPVTIEIWARQNAVKKWARVFDINGGNDQNDFYVSWSWEWNSNGDQIELKTGNVVRWQIQNNFSPYTLGSEYLIVATLEPNFEGSGNTRYTFRKVEPSTGTILKTAYQEIADSMGSPAKIAQSQFWLGHSIYSDNDAAASYNEVRVLKTALSEAQICADSICGPDAWPYVAMVGDLNYGAVGPACAAATEGTTMTVIGDARGQTIPLGTVISGALVFNANTKLSVDLTGLESATTTVLTVAGGITLPNGADIADYVRFPDEWYNSAFVSVTLAENNTQVRVTYDLDVPVTAEWTGNGDHVSLSDPANWTCRNVIGTELPDRLPSPTQTRAIFEGNLSFSLTDTQSWQTTSFGTVKLTGNCDWSALDLTSLLAGGTIDLNGYSLTLSTPAGVSAIPFTFTDTLGSGELHLVVPEGTSFVWKGAALTGNVKLVKEGLGILEVGSIASTCTMDVIGGMANGIPAAAFDASMFLAHRWSFNGDLTDSVGGQTATTGGSISYDEGATVTLPGGKSGAGWVALGGDVLPKDGSPVTIEIWARQNAVKNWGRIFDIHGGNEQNDFYMSWSNGTNLNGDQVELKTGNTVRWQITNNFGPYTLGTEYLIVATLEPNFEGSGNTRYTFRKVDPATGTILKTAYKDIADSMGSPAKISQTQFWLGHSIYGSYGDNDAAASYNEVRVWKAALTVEQLLAQACYGADQVAFQPAAALNGRGYFTLDEAFAAASAGNTITIRASQDAHPVSIYKTTLGALTFESGAKIVIDLADYAEEVVLAAAGGITLPNGTSITDVVEFSDPAFAPQLSNDGKRILAVSLTIPVTATWLGGGETLVVTDPANWRCRNARGDVIPDAIPNATYTVVTVSGETQFSVPTVEEAIWKEISIGSCTLATNCNWTGLGSKYEMTGTVDLRGHDLTIAGFSAAGGFTDTATEGGTLHVNVPANVTLTNAAIPLTGSLTLVKEGAGMLVASKTGQTYTGGTRITGGTIRLGASMSNGTLGASDTDIQIDAGGFLDSYGTFNNYNHTIVLNGGKLGNMLDRDNNDWQKNHFGNVRLTADSEMEFKRGGLLGQGFGPIVLDLQTHTLTWTGSGSNKDAWTWFCNTTVMNGTLIVKGDWMLGNFSSTNPGVDARTATVEIQGKLGIDNVTLKAGNYICNTTTQPNNLKGTMTVSGKFTPKTNYFYGFIAQNGASFDLSEQTLPWSTTGLVTGGNVPKTITFADGATITVDVGGRKLHNGDPVIVWTSAPANLNTLRFKLPSGRMGELITKPTGVYYACGFTIFVR